MKLLAITDLHDHPAALDRILEDAPEVAGILLGGDITNFGSPADAQRLVQQARQSGAIVMAVAGNCDSAAIETRLVELGVSLFRRGVMHFDAGLHGLSAMPPWRDTMYHFSEAELAEHLETGYQQIAEAAGHVVLSHAPPHDTRLDRTFTGRHVGSTALRAFVERARPDLVVCGHIHEARGVDTLGPTTMVNCGPAAAGYYAVVDVADTVTVDLCKA